MSLKSRLDRLEKQIGPGPGACPGCGFADGDVRTLVLQAVSPRHDAQPAEMSQVVRDRPSPDQPGRPRCPDCGGYMPPIAIVKDFDSGKAHESGQAEAT